MLILTMRSVWFDANGKCILEGFQSLDNYYTLTSPSHTCHKIDSDNTKLWHERIGHLNYKSLKKLSDIGTICGLPKVNKLLVYVVLVNRVSNLRPLIRFYIIPQPPRYWNYCIWILWVLCKLRA